MLVTGVATTLNIFVAVGISSYLIRGCLRSIASKPSNMNPCIEIIKGFMLPNMRLSDNLTIRHLVKDADRNE